jgi:hypothetical protein
MSQPTKPADLGKRGMLRIKNGFLQSHSAVVQFGRFGTFTVPEDHYRSQGYEPDFDQLPWRDEQASEER